MTRSSSSPFRIRSLVRPLIAAATLAGATTFAAPAEAVPSFTLDRATIGGGLRWASEDLEIGIGVRGGYTLGQGIYIGGVFDYFFGDDDDTDFGGFASTDVDYNVWDLMGVVGYDAGLTPSITIRPFGGFGIVHQDVEWCQQALGLENCFDDSESDAGAVIGGEVLFEISNSLHVGPEIRILIFEDTAFMLGGNFGGTF
jgi:hypothetical protein